MRPPPPSATVITLFLNFFLAVTKPRIHADLGNPQRLHVLRGVERRRRRN
jgi:hypothetical protein